VTWTVHVRSQVLGARQFKGMLRWASKFLGPLLPLLGFVAGGGHPVMALFGKVFDCGGKCSEKMSFSCGQVGFF